MATDVNILDIDTPDANILDVKIRDVDTAKGENKTAMATDSDNTMISRPSITAVAVMASPSRTLTATAPIIATGVLGSPGPILTATSALTTAAIIESPGPILTAATAVASTRILLFVLDRDGDLCIRAGKQNPMEFKVDSGALRRASDKFRQKLLGDWLATKPASSDETWLVVLEDAYPYALKVLLQLIHASRLDEIRDDLPIRTIREIVGLVEKWNLHHIVRHRASQWLELAINMAGTTTMVRDLVDINWVALGMGHMALFTQTINRIATMTKCDHNGNLLDSEGLVLQNHYTFPDDDFLDQIGRQRTRFIGEYLGFIQNAFTLANSCIKPFRQIGEAGPAQTFGGGGFGTNAATADERLICTSCTIGEMTQKIMQESADNHNLVDILSKTRYDFLPTLLDLEATIRQILNTKGRYHGPDCTFANRFEQFHLDLLSELHTRRIVGATVTQHTTMTDNWVLYGQMSQKLKTGLALVEAPTAMTANQAIGSSRSAAQGSSSQPIPFPFKRSGSATGSHT